jgi:prepilin-type N-terminal cleavage/methylation domain-containing protein
MKKRHHKQKRAYGFTIIEVMIVLAIAGLIMMVVFLAVPAVQQTSRDAGRKQAVAMIETQLNDYRTTHNLQYPSTAERCQFIKSYLTEYLNGSPSCDNGGCTDGVLVQGNVYSFCFHNAATSPHSYLDPNQDEISIQTGHWCNLNEGVTDRSGDPITSNGNDQDLRFAAVWTSLERARLICVDNH